MGKVLSYFGLVGLAALVTSLTGFSPQQVLSITVFASFIVGTLLYWPFRLAFAFGGIAILMTAGLLDVPHLIEFASLDVILFLIGMMTIVGFLEEQNYFEWALEKALPFIGGSATKLMTSLMIISFISAALVDEVTSILFMAAITLRLAKHYEVNPVPFIIMVVFATNIGSSATVVGNPIGVLIALRAGLTFPDFLRWATPISVGALVVTVVTAFIFFKRPMKELDDKIKAHAKAVAAGDTVASRQAREAEDETAAADAEGSAEKTGSKSMLFPSLLFVATVAGLVLHGQIEALFGLETNTMLVGVALLAAAVVLFVERDRARQLVEKRVDWWTLSFFMLLFASAGTLRYVGATAHIAEGMITATDGDVTILLGVITWSIGLLSALMDNVLAVASFIPIVGDLADVGVNVMPLWWGMLFGGTVLGNLTLIGSTANIVALGLLEREGKSITFMEWFWPGLVTSVPSLALATVALYAQLPLMLQ